MLPEGIYEQMIVYIFLSFWIVGPQRGHYRTESAKSSPPFLFATSPVLVSSPTDVRVDHLQGSLLSEGVESENGEPE